LAFILSIQAQDCHTCKDCVKCLSSFPGSTSTTKIVQLSTAQCSHDPVNWLCCRSASTGTLYDSGCVLHDCNSLFEDDKNYESNMCNDVSTLLFEVPSNATSVRVQVQENNFNGDKDCDADGDCCCGSYTSCLYAISGVCEIVVSLDDCISDYPEPDCDSDDDCSHLSQQCSTGVCQDGTCIEVNIPAHTLCRPAGGDCDEPEFCTGYDNFCPEDVKKSEGHICRYKVDYTECDFEEECDGWSNDCPEDTWEVAGVECRPVADKCDVAEYCTGDSPYCPEDFGNDHAYTFKCSTTQFLCGVKRSELSQNAGGSYFIGTGSANCGIGTATNFVDLDYPACLDQCLNSKCPNNRGLSNWSQAHCDPNTGNWVCDDKGDVISSTKLPHCFDFKK